MNKFIWNKKEQAHFQKDNLNGWCVIVGFTPNGEYPEYQVSDGLERTTSYDYTNLNEAFKKCVELNHTKEEA